MRNLLLLVIATLLQAQNPAVFSAIGDPIYNDALHVERLMSSPSFASKKSAITIYLTNLEQTKENGFALENGNKKISTKQYVSDLRVMDKQNAKYRLYVLRAFKDSIKAKNSEQFTNMVNSGLLNTKKEESAIIKYYKANRSDINPTGKLQKILSANNLIGIKKQKKVRDAKYAKADKRKSDREAKEREAKQKKAQKKANAKKKKKYVSSNIERIRANDRAKQKRIKDKVDRQHKKTQHMIDEIR